MLLFACFGATVLVASSGGGVCMGLLWNRPTHADVSNEANLEFVLGYKNTSSLHGGWDGGWEAGG